MQTISYIQCVMISIIKNKLFGIAEGSDNALTSKMI